MKGAAKVHQDLSSKQSERPDLPIDDRGERCCFARPQSGKGVPVEQ